MRLSTACICLAWSAACGCASTGQTGMVIASAGESDARLVTHKSGAHQAVVADLQRILYSMTGALVPTAQGRPEAGSIFIGTGAEASEAGAGISIPDLKHEEILLAQKDDRLYLIGGSSAGVSHAVYTWLHRLGCRWFMPGEPGEHIPDRPRLLVPEFTYRHAPSFTMRTIWYAWGPNTPLCSKQFGEWARRNCQGAYPRVSHGHNFSGLLPHDKYFKEHPEYYALIRGKRVPSQLCTSNPDVIRLVSEHIIERFDKQTGGPYTISLCPDDSNDFCECENCRALDVGKPDPFDEKKPWVTDRLMVFWNAVAERVARKYPDAIMGFYAYVSHTAPPEREKIHRCLAPVITGQQFCVMHSVADEWCKFRQTMRKMLKRYCELSNNVYIYDYDPPVGHMDLPSPLFRTHALDLPLYHKMGIKGFSWECHDSWATTSPNLWMNAQLMWDVEQDPDELMSSYLRDFFGPAAEPMRRYYDALVACYEQRDVHTGWSKPMQIYREDLVQAMRKAMNEALAAADDDLTRRRVQMVNLGLKYLEAYRVLYNVEEHQDYGLAQGAIEQIECAIDTCYSTNEEYLLTTQPRKWLGRYSSTMRHYLPLSKWFQQRNEVWVQFPDRWRVTFEAEAGQPPDNWLSADFDDAKWRLLKANEMWHRQVEPRLSGCAWGRCRFRAPAACAGKKLFLFVGALDERGSIYLNGELVHVRTGLEHQDAWTQPFKFEVTGKIRPGEENILGVAAAAESTIGGLWRPIWLYSPKD